MTYDHELVLINGDVENVILCGKKSVSRSEFYNAAVAELKPEVIFIIHPYEYDGQKKVRFEGIRYSVIRAYEVNSEELELTCEVRIGG